jgi:hypothetical protein
MRTLHRTFTGFPHFNFEVDLTQKVCGHPVKHAQPVKKKRQRRA